MKPASNSPVAMEFRPNASDGSGPSRCKCFTRCPRMSYLWESLDSGMYPRVVDDAANAGASPRFENAWSERMWPLPNAGSSACLRARARTLVVAQHALRVSAQFAVRP